MLERYGLQTSVEDGPHVVPFLLYLAQRIPAAVTPIPWGDPKTYNPEEAKARKDMHTCMQPPKRTQIDEREEGDRDTREEET